MGKQVNFYLLSADESLFLNQVLKDSNIKIIRSRFSKPTPETVTIESLVNSQDRKFYFWDTRYSLKKYISIVQDSSYNSELARIVPTGKTYFCISDEGSAPIIEYSHSKINPDGILVRGRIWADMYELNDDKTKLVYKSETFVKWYDGLAHWLRQNLLRVKGVHEYFGKQALEWFREGGLVGNSSDGISWDQVLGKQ